MNEYLSCLPPEGDKAVDKVLLGNIAGLVDTRRILKLVDWWNFAEKEYEINYLPNSVHAVLYDSQVLRYYYDVKDAITYAKMNPDMNESLIWEFAFDKVPPDSPFSLQNLVHQYVSQRIIGISQERLAELDSWYTTVDFKTQVLESVPIRTRKRTIKRKTSH